MHHFNVTDLEFREQVMKKKFENCSALAEICFLYPLQTPWRVRVDVKYCNDGIPIDVNDRSAFIGMRKLNADITAYLCSKSLSCLLGLAIIPRYLSIVSYELQLFTAKSLYINLYMYPWPCLCLECGDERLESQSLFLLYTFHQ